MSLKHLGDQQEAWNNIGLPKIVLADTGFASGPAVADLHAHGIEPLVAIGRTQPHRPYDFRPPPPQTTPRRITEPWRLAMKASWRPKMPRTSQRRKQTIEPVFGIIKSAMGFVRSTCAASKRLPPSGP